MPQTEGGGTVFVGGPGSKIGLPIYGGFRPVTGSVPATPNLLFNSSGVLGFNALSSTVLQMAQLTLTNTQVNGMEAAPIQLIAAPGAGNVILVDSLVLNVVYGSAAFGNGGAIGLYYGTTNQTYPATATTAATFLTSPGGGTANGLALALGALASGTASSNQINQAVSISNATAPFITGTGCSLIVTAYYAILAAS